MCVRESGPQLPAAAPAPVHTEPGEMRCVALRNVGQPGGEEGAGHSE